MAVSDTEHPRGLAWLGFYKSGEALTFLEDFTFEEELLAAQSVDRRARLHLHIYKLFPQ
jgi:hypothetical protein